MEHIFKTQRLLIRPYTTNDFEDFYRIHGNEEIMRFIRPPKNRQQAWDFLIENIEGYAKQPHLGRWAMLSSNEQNCIGSFAIIPVKDSDDIQLGYVLLKENWGQGYASEAVKGGLDYAFNTIGVKTIAGITETGNSASQHVLLKNGFVFEKSFYEEEKELFLYRRNAPL